jgi:hypothetical protein
MPRAGAGGQESSLNAAVGVAGVMVAAQAAAGGVDGLAQRLRWTLK